MQASTGAVPWVHPEGTLGALTRSARERAEAVAASLLELQARARDLPHPPAFSAALRGGSIRVIAEVKRASPSKGAIAPGLNAADQAIAYVTGGSAAISVLTEPSRFGGSLVDLADVTAAVRVPVIRKDFLIHPVQLWEARVHGASAALLIVRSLAPGELKEMMRAAVAAGLEALVEVRNEAELERAIAAGARVIGVNNRNLETLEIDPHTAPRLIAQIPAHIIAVAESGMRTVSDVSAAAAAGADAILVGSAVSAAADPAGAVRELASIPRVAR